MILTLCSVAYPLAKIVVLSALWLAPFPARGRRSIVRVMRLLGRWSLIDVIAVTMIVVGSRSIGFLVNARPLTGCYVYAASIITLMLATVLMDWLARPRRQ